MYSLLSFFIDASISSESEKTRSKAFLELILVHFFKWSPLIKRCLSNEFDEDKFHAKLSAIGNGVQDMDCEEVDINRWVYSEDEPIYVSKDGDLYIDENSVKKEIQLNTIENEKGYEFEYLPAKEVGSKILYASESFYVFLRFLYALYERIIRMREVAESEEK